MKKVGNAAVIRNARRILRQNAYRKAYVKDYNSIVLYSQYFHLM